MNVPLIILLQLLLTFPYTSFATEIDAGKFYVGMEDIVSFQVSSLSTDKSASNSYTFTESAIGLSASGVSLGYFIVPNFMLGANVGRYHTRDDNTEITNSTYKVLVRYYLPFFGQEKGTAVVVSSFGMLSNRSESTNPATDITTIRETNGNVLEFGGGFAYQLTAGTLMEFTLRRTRQTRSTNSVDYTLIKSGTVLGMALSVVF